MIRPFGERALLVETGSADRAQALAAALAGAEGIVATVPGLQSLLVELEVGAGAVEDVIATRLADVSRAPATPGQLHEIAVRYGGEDGPEFAGVAAELGLGEDEFIGLHAGTELRVLFCGFAPGFAYLGDLPEALRIPRLATPRTRTPAGSVAIAGAMSGIYPADLPGGWRVIGRTGVTLFDPRADPPSLLVPGDRVRFVPDG